ncbi:unnamed protein product, partial [Iphiclides podalirius]
MENDDRAELDGRSGPRPDAPWHFGWRHLGVVSRSSIHRAQIPSEEALQRPLGTLRCVSPAVSTPTHTRPNYQSYRPQPLVHKNFRAASKLYAPYGYSRVHSHTRMVLALFRLQFGAPSAIVPSRSVTFHGKSEQSGDYATLASLHVLFTSIR